MIVASIPLPFLRCKGSRIPLRVLRSTHKRQIGSHARSEGLILVANNLREFARMPGLRVENWV